MEISDRINRAIKAAGGQVELATALHVSQGTISRWKNGKFSPQWDKWTEAEPRLAKLEAKLGLKSPVASRK